MMFNVSAKNVRHFLINEASWSSMMSQILKERYQTEVVPALMKTLSLDNIMEVPRINKVVVNIGLGEALDNPKALDAAVADLNLIAGQKPIVTKARKSIANFKLREGRAIGAKVTLRGERMWSFLDRLVNIALPRVRDFRGVSPDSFDGRGNYTLGLREQLVFPEIEYDKIDKLRGLEISIITTATSDDHGRELLRMLGMPFKKEG
jgi:large subunit ribosomal protein L5